MLKIVKIANCGADNAILVMYLLFKDDRNLNKSLSGSRGNVNPRSEKVTGTIT